MRTLPLLLFILVSFTCGAQQFTISFESSDTLYPHICYIDTVSNPNNTWQVGHPQKNIFNSGHYDANGIVTDTINSYPANDTSVFYLKVPGWVPFNTTSNWYGPLYRLQFAYQMDIDSGDYGIIEYSRDSGQTWINIYEDSLLSWSHARFDTSTTGWHIISIFRYTFPDGINVSYSDSIFFKFSFISDSIPSTKDGWIIDDIGFDYFFSSVHDIYTNNIFTLSPNPSGGHIKLASKTQQQPTTIQVYNLNGQKVYETNALPPSGDLYLDLPNGVYVLKYSTEDYAAVQRLIIQR